MAARISKRQAMVSKIKKDKHPFTGDSCLLAEMGWSSTHQQNNLHAINLNSMSFKITGRLPWGKHKEQLQKSPNYNGKGFKNLSPTPMMASDASYWKMTRDFFRKNKNAFPPSVLPFVKTNLHSLQSAEPQLVWFGHSSYLIHLNNKNILVDPVFSGSAAPFSFMVKAFSGSNVYSVKDMPEIDYLILTHDHYDHLDYKTIIGIRSKVKKISCSLGLSSHLKHWGIGHDIITEMDWWNEQELDEEIKLIAAPARHFSGRGLKRAQTLWSSFILTTSAYTIYIGGDSGYDNHFKSIGEKYGPFDLVILEAGQYNTMWPLIHMVPEETVQAAIDLKAKALLPVHWGKFSLAMHEWNEPVRRVVKKAEEVGMQVITPKIGEAVRVGGKVETSAWWERL
jgi:L-ascorbate metabolism protein UlaG (beta-lactamase superfamily)